MSKPGELSSSGPHHVARIVGLVEFVFRRTDKAGDIFPSDEPHGFVEGTDPARVVVLGESNAVGLGVTQHQLGMAGHVARRFAAKTGRGVHWSAVEVRANKISNAWESVENNRDLLANANVVVLMMGIVDVLSLTGTQSWAAHLSNTLDCLTQDIPRDAIVLVTRIPPMDNAGSVSRLARLAAGRQARLFNRKTDGILRNYKNCTPVTFPEMLREELWVPKSRQEPYVRMYSAWASAAVAELPDDSLHRA
jgi:hypothetical protein